MSPDGNPCITAEPYREVLTELYRTYNRREYVHPDPLEFLYDYPDIRDREIVGLLAACLAYGNVHQILKSVSGVLKLMGKPFSFLSRSSVGSLRKEFQSFQYRFTKGEELVLLFMGIKGIIERYGSLSKCFCAGLSDEHETVLQALGHFVNELVSCGEGRPATLLPLPERGSACKRLNLFLRWMVRCDCVDPGGWQDIPASKLVVPVDVHILRICSRLGLTHRKQADVLTAIQITSAFRAIEPNDPVKYDFAISRLGIRNDLSPNSFFEPYMVRMPPSRNRRR